MIRKNCIHITACLLALLSFFLASLIPQSSFGQNPLAHNQRNMVAIPSSNQTHYILGTERGHVNVLVDLGTHGQSSPKLVFLNSTTNQTEPNVDYDIIVTPEHANNIVYKASEQAGQTDRPLRAVDGVASIPDQSFAQGGYDVTVNIYGINGIPFPTVDRTEFTYQVIIVVA